MNEAREMTIDEGFEKLRDLQTETIRLSQWLEKKVEPPVVQEIVLARRAAEDSRMRFGVGQAYHRGFDPWTNRVNEK